VEERGPIQVIPPGLLGLLQLKADGRSVSKLGDTCIPSLEMLGFWLRSKMQATFTSSTANPAAAIYQVFQPFTTNPVVVPDGQWWYVHDYAVKFIAGAGATGTSACAASSMGVTTIDYVALSDSVDINANGKMVRCQPFWLPPGARLGFYVDTVVGATFQAIMTALRYTVCTS